MADYLPGDILFIDGGTPIDRVIQWATISPFNHVALVGYATLYEALTNGVAISPETKYAKYRTWHGRVDGITPNQIIQLIMWVNPWVGRHYGWREALDSGVRDVLHVPVRPRPFHHLDCSGLVAAAFASVRMPLTRAIVPTPADLWASELIKEVK